MTDADAFLAAIAANPHDDLPKVVFADWLEEHGEPEYAALIRTHCEIKSGPPMHPDQRREVRRRRYELSQEVRRAWAEKYPNLDLSRWLFLDGISYPSPVFVTARDFLDRDLTLPYFVPPRLRIHGYLGCEAELVSCGQLARYERLEIVDYPEPPFPPRPPFPPVTDTLLRGLARSPHLGRLTNLFLGYICPSRGGLESFADSALVARLGEFGFDFILDHLAHRDIDIRARTPPHGACREAIRGFLAEYGDLLPVN